MHLRVRILIDFQAQSSVNQEFKVLPLSKAFVISCFYANTYTHTNWLGTIYSMENSIVTM